MLRRALVMLSYCVVEHTYLRTEYSIAGKLLLVLKASSLLYIIGLFPSNVLNLFHVHNDRI